MKIKLITGFRRDQEHSIDADEAHKAYYLFLHPEARGIFKNGLALIGSEIKEIVPDWQGTMGWNPSHNLGGDDWNEIMNSGVGRKLSRLMSAAKEVATIGAPEDIQRPLTQLLEEKYPKLIPPSVERREGRVKSVGDMLPKKDS